MTTYDESQTERRKRVREEHQQPSTYHGRTDPDGDLGGRYLKQEGARAQVVGQQGAPTYPKLPSSSPWSGPDPVPNEPSFGVPVGGHSYPEQEMTLGAPTVVSLPCPDLGRLATGPAAGRANGRKASA